MTEAIREEARRRALRDAAYRYDKPVEPSVGSHTHDQDAHSGKQGLPCRTRSRSWVADVASKAYSMARVVTSPPCSDFEHERRQAACAACPHLTTAESGRYCECCGCAKWSGSELSRKNRFSAHRCPADPPRF